MEAAVKSAKALSDGNRIRVVLALMEHQELCACQLIEMLQLAAPTVSRHLGILCSAGLVESRRDGRWVFYQLASSVPDELGKWLRTTCADSPAIAADRANLQQIVCHKPAELFRAQMARRGCCEE